MKYRVAILLLGMLTACDAQQKAQLSGHANDFKRNLGKLGQGIRNAFTYTQDPVYVKASQTRYCYATYTEPVCYDTPQTGNVGNLVGYQGPEPLPRELDHRFTEGAINGNAIQAVPTEIIESSDLTTPQDVVSGTRPFGEATIINQSAPAPAIKQDNSDSGPVSTGSPSTLLPRL